MNFTILLLLCLLGTTYSQFDCSSYTNEEICTSNSIHTCVWCSYDIGDRLDSCYSSNPCTNQIYNVNCSDIIKGSNYPKCDEYLMYDFLLFCIVSFMMCITILVCGYRCFRYDLKYKNINNRMIGIVGFCNFILSILYTLSTLILIIIIYLLLLIFLYFL